MIYAIDLDMTLTKDTSWNPDDCAKAKPNLQMIGRINELHKTNFIIIHTARRHALYNKTIDWLDKWGVRYHAVAMDKLPSDFYVDDKAYNPNCSECMKNLEKKKATR